MEKADLGSVETLELVVLIGRTRCFNICREGIRGYVCKKLIAVVEVAVLHFWWQGFYNSYPLLLTRVLNLWMDLVTF